MCTLKISSAILGELSNAHYILGELSNAHVCLHLWPLIQIGMHPTLLFPNNVWPLISSGLNEKHNWFSLEFVVGQTHRSLTFFRKLSWVHWLQTNPYYYMKGWPCGIGRKGIVVHAITTCTILHNKLQYISSCEVIYIYK